MIPTALTVTVIVGLAVTELARLGRCSRRWPQGFLAVAFALLAAHIATTVPVRVLYAVAFYGACLALLALVAIIALWPVLADVFDRPRRSRR